MGEGTEAQGGYVNSSKLMPQSNGARLGTQEEFTPSPESHHNEEFTWLLLYCSQDPPTRLQETLWKFINSWRVIDFQSWRGIRDHVTQFLNFTLKRWRSDSIWGLNKWFRGTGLEPWATGVFFFKNKYSFFPAFLRYRWQIKIVYI